MKKRGFKKLIITAISIAALCIALTACGACEHTYDNSCDPTCNQCGEGRAAGHRYVPADCESPRYCSICGEAEGEALDHDMQPATCTEPSACYRCPHTEGEALDHDMQPATCIAPSTCSRCPHTEGDIDPDNHVTEEGLCECKKIDARSMAAEDLENILRDRIRNGEQELYVTLAPDAPAEMLAAIRTALVYSSNIPSDGLDLTIAGVTEIPEDAFGVVYQGYSSFAVQSLRSICLPDVITVHESAFSSCKLLSRVILPKAEVIHDYAFSTCALTYIEAPKAISVGLRSFGFSTAEITYVDLSSCTSVGRQAFIEDSSYGQFADGATLLLTAAGAISFSDGMGIHGDFFGTHDTTPRINLVLNIDKKDGDNSVTVTEKSDGTFTVKIIDEGGKFSTYCFKSVSFTCTDGTLNHSVSYEANEETHSAVCLDCEAVLLENQPHFYFGEGEHLQASELSFADRTVESHSIVCCCGHKVVRRHRMDSETSSCTDCGLFIVNVSANNEGDSVFLTFDPEEKIITVSGIGATADFESSNRAWLAFSEDVIEIIVEEGVVYIGENMFEGFRSATAVRLPSTLEVIGNYAFSFCDSLVAVDISNGLNRIGLCAFGACASLEYITLPSSLTYVESYAFHDCMSIKEINIPKDLRTIEANAFRGCNASFVVDESNHYYSSDEDGVLFNKDKTLLICYSNGNATHYEVPESVKIIAEAAFRSAESLKSVVLPEGLERIECSAFTGLALESITIPASVECIESVAFSSCWDLKEITILSSNIEIDSLAFLSCDNLVSINVPCDWSEEEHPLDLNEEVTLNKQHAPTGGVCDNCGEVTAPDA